ncbi:MAG TPA: site-2 protease family protein [Verrucomicrobiae bacterium]
MHIDLIGTVAVPLLMIFGPFGMGRFMIGWAKPVPVNPQNLRNKNFDDILVTMAGPGMNLILAVGLVALMRVSVAFHSVQLALLCDQAARLSLLLCFFNLIPIPPLDGSHVLRVATGMSWEAYAKFASFGFVIVILALQIPSVQAALAGATDGTLYFLERLFGMNF